MAAEETGAAGAREAARAAEEVGRGWRLSPPKPRGVRTCLQAVRSSSSVAVFFSKHTSVYFDLRILPQMADPKAGGEEGGGTGGSGAVA